MTLTFNSPLLAEIHAAIAKNQGRIPFDEFMDFALYSPKGGYYRQNKPLIGEKGDFITAPDISPLFSHCLARCFKQLQTTLPEATILEFGAGNGSLAADCLEYLLQINALPKRYYILELSAQLAKTQKETIARKHPACLAIVEWISSIPPGLKSMVIANEVLDAMSVKLFRIQSGVLTEGYVASCNNEFIRMHAEPSKALQNYIDELPDYFKSTTFYESEANLLITPWLQSLSDMLECGVVFLIDYGFPANEYYHPTRSMGTLMCHSQHRAHTNPFLHVGEQDITAHVDFTAVANAAIRANFHVSGYTTQAHFLLNSGLLSDLDGIELTYQTSQAIQRLTMPHEMGEIFKVMALTKNVSEPFGFANGDQRHKL